MPRSTARPAVRTSSASITALVFAAASLTGCASTENGSASAQSASKTIRIAYQKFPSGDLVVKHERLLEQALPGYTIEWKAFDSGASVNTAFIAKAVDIAAIGSSPVARGLSAPLNIPYKVAYILDVAGTNEALVARNGSGVKTVADLRGRRIATPFASTSHYSLLEALRHNGLAEKDVKLIDLQPQDILAAWQRGDIDAAYTWLPSLDTLRATGTTLVTSADVAKWGKPTLDLGVVSNTLIKDHPDVVDAWRKAQAQGTETILKRRTVAANAVAAELSISATQASHQLSQGIFLNPEQQVSAAWLGKAGAPGGVATNLADGAAFLNELGKIPSTPAPDVFANAIYTQGLPDELTK